MQTVLPVTAVIQVFANQGHLVQATNSAQVVRFARAGSVPQEQDRLVASIQTAFPPKSVSNNVANKWMLVTTHARPLRLARSSVAKAAVFPRPAPQTRSAARAYDVSTTLVQKQKPTVVAAVLVLQDKSVSTTSAEVALVMFVRAMKAVSLASLVSSWMEKVRVAALASPQILQVAEVAFSV